MSLLARVQDTATCSIPECSEPRVEGTLFGRECGHGNDWIAGRIERRGDGSFALGPRARANEPAWLARAHRQPHGLARDLSQVA